MKSAETTPSQAEPLIIRFGPDGDSQEIVENVKINFSVGKALQGESDMDVRKFYTDKFDEVSIMKSCNELYFICKKDKKEVGELYIPMHVMVAIWVDYKIE